MCVCVWGRWYSDSHSSRLPSSRHPQARLYFDFLIGWVFQLGQDSASLELYAFMYMASITIRLETIWLSGRCGPNPIQYITWLQRRLINKVSMFEATVERWKRTVIHRRWMQSSDKAQHTADTTMPTLLYDYSVMFVPYACNMCLTNFPFFSSSPYIHPSLSSGISKMMTSPSSKLINVLLLPALWGKMVRTRGLLTTLLRPVATDTDLDRAGSSMLLWSDTDNKDMTWAGSYNKAQ